MRITNSMMQNNMMLNINKNSRQTDSLYNQIGSGKKINLPSEDPIIASRSLRYKASINATEQYQRNNDQAMAWTSTTSTAFKNTVEQLKNIKEAFTKGANDTMSLSERKDYATSIKACLEEISSQMNTTFAGRYIFSGYRTDEPSTFLKATDAAYEINQDLQYEDLMQVKSYWKQDGQTAAEMVDVASLRLPYAQVKNIELKDSTGAVIPVTTKSIADPTNPYAGVPAGGAVYIEETGELLLGETTQQQLLNGDLSIKYDKENFLKGELNPKVYFDCTVRTSGIVEGDRSNANYVQKVDQNGNPVFEADGTTPVYESYNMDIQDLMSYELSYKTKIKINSLAKDSFTDNLYADLNTSISRVLGMEISTEAALKLKYSQAPYSLSGDELTEAIEKQISTETTQISAIIQDEFSSMLDKISSHMSGVSRQYTDLGAREKRLEMIQTRLEEDLLNLQTLNSENEDVDYEEAITKLNIVSGIYDASLKITAKISGMTLLNYM